MQQLLLIFIDLTQHFLPLRHRLLRSQLPSPQNFIGIPSKVYYLSSLVRLPPPLIPETLRHHLQIDAFQGKLLYSYRFDLQRPFYVTAADDARLSSASRFIMCSSFSKVSFTSQGEITQHILQKTDPLHLAPRRLCCLTDAKM